MTWYGINFRASAAGVGGAGGSAGVDGANHTYALNNDAWTGSAIRDSLIFGVSPGYGGTMGVASDNFTTGDVRCRGNMRFANQVQWYRVGLAGGAGQYNFRGAMYVPGGATQQANIYVWDGDVSDPVNSATETTVNGKVLGSYPAASGAVAALSYCFSNGKMYRTTSGGNVSATPTPPSHASGTVSDGTVAWTYIRSALFYANAAVAANNICDLTGTTYTTVANWAAAAGGGGAQTSTLTVNNSYVTLTRGTDLSVGITFFSSFEYQQATTPLVDPTFKDQFGTTVANPTIYANEASGTPLFQIVATAGSVSPSAWAITGALSSYLSVATVNGGLWVVASSTRLPDALAGTQSVTLTQTDNSASISGSPHATTFNVTVTTSNGRNTTSTSIYGLIAGGTYDIRRRVAAVHASELWPGYQGQAFATSQDVTDGTTFQNAFNALAPTGTSWHRFRFKAGGTGFDQSITLNNKDFGSGGVLLEPYPGDDPEINLQMSSPTSSNIHFRNLLNPGGPCSTPQYYTWYFGRNGSVWPKVKVENCRLGYMYKTGAVETNIGLTVSGVANTPTYSSNMFFVRGGASFEMTGCTSDGAGMTALLMNVRVSHIEGNRRVRPNDDFNPIGWGEIDEPIGVFADDNLYHIIRNNLDDKEVDYAGAPAPGGHLDFCQLRPWAAGSAPYGTQRVGRTTTNWAVGDKTFNGSNWYQVSAITTGVASGTPPTHTSGTAVDGGVTWQYGGPFNPNRKLYLDMEENYIVSAKTTATTDGPIKQMLLDSSDDEGTCPFQFYGAVYNNFFTSGAVYGIAVAKAGELWAEYNVLAGPYLDRASFTPLPPKFQMLHASNGKLWDRGNVTGAANVSTSTKLMSYGSQVISFLSGQPNPNAYLAGTFTAGAQTGIWTFPITDTVATATSTVKASVRSQLLAKSGVSNLGPIIASASANPNRWRCLGLKFGLGF